jgi:hypothetical protein
MSEAAFQMDLVTFMRAYGRPDVVWWHVPNGEKRTRRTGAKLMKMGVRPGVADLTVLLRGECHQLELKDADGRMSKDQERFMEDVQRAGGTYHVAASMHEAIGILTQIGALRVGVRLTNSTAAARSGCAGKAGVEAPADLPTSSPRAIGVLA